MTDRQRFQRRMSYQPADRLPALVLEPFEVEAIARWRTEGLPADAEVCDYLGLCPLHHAPVHFGPIPGFEPLVLADDGTYETVVSDMGATLRRRKDHPTMFYGHVDHPVKTHADWERYRERFQPPGRVPERWQSEVVPRLRASQRPVGLSFFPFFFRLGFYALGMERFLAGFYEQPSLIHEMFAYWADFVTEVVRPLLGTVAFDYAVFNEDLAGKNGPLVSPRIYEEFWRPYQEPLLRLLQQHGIPVICQWSAGQFDALLPSMLEQGFNCIWPLEVMAGNDPAALRRRFGRDLLLAGGIAKEAVIAGPAAIDAELERLTPMIREGGFIPALDDMAAPDMPWAHYRYLAERVRGIGF
jgi:uroporphyrinogen decarboxylase